MDDSGKKTARQEAQNAIQRRIKRVLARFTIWSILFGLGAALGLGLRGIGPLKRN